MKVREKGGKKRTREDKVEESEPKILRKKRGMKEGLEIY
jgi:hypothetical protein